MYHQRLIIKKKISKAELSQPIDDLLSKDLKADIDDDGNGRKPQCDVPDDWQHRKKEARVTFFLQGTVRAFESFSSFATAVEAATSLL